MRNLLNKVFVRLFLFDMTIRQRLFLLYLRSRKAKLAGSDLSYLDLSGADLQGANLRGANLRRSDLTNTNLKDADLTGADLSGALVTEFQLARARSLDGATLPDGSVFE